MANPEHLAILKQGVKAWNEWRTEHSETPNLSGESFFHADLRQADLSGADLRGTSLVLTNFIGANFSEAKLRSANLFAATLVLANLSRADLTGTDLGDTNLEGANLSGAELTGANLRRARLGGANLSNANLSKAHLNGADLSEAKLQGANLNEADLGRANLQLADLRGCNISRADLSWSDLTRADLSGADLRETNLIYADLVETNLDNTNLGDCRVYGVSAWSLRLNGARQSNLIITNSNEPTITVDNLELAQFIYLLLNNEKIRDVIDTVARKVVLILGRLTPERKAVLDAIRNELRQRDYLPVLFDFDKPAARNITETVRTLAHLSRFIIADLTEPSSIPQELYAIIPTLAVAIQPVLESGEREYSMFVDLRTTYHWVLPIAEYKDTEELLASLGDKVIAPAEAKAKELERR